MGKFFLYVGLISFDQKKRFKWILERRDFWMRDKMMRAWQKIMHIQMEKAIFKTTKALSVSQRQ